MRVIVLTDKPSQKKIYIFADQIKLIEDLEIGGTHICFGGDMGRVVVETKEQIFSVLGIAPAAI